jgi:hypothetical protein
MNGQQSQAAMIEARAMARSTNLSGTIKAGNLLLMGSRARLERCLGRLHLGNTPTGVGKTSSLSDLDH